MWGGLCCEKLPQLLVSDTGLCSMGAFENPPPLPWPGDPSSAGGGGKGVREVSPGHPGKPLSLRRSCPWHRQGFCVPAGQWAAAG